MDEDNSTRLAEVYQTEITQCIVIFPYLWKHYPDGNWFVNWNFPEDCRYQDLAKGCHCYIRLKEQLCSIVAVTTIEQLEEMIK